MIMITTIIILLNSLYRGELTALGHQNLKETSWKYRAPCPAGVLMTVTASTRVLWALLCSICRVTPGASIPISIARNPNTEAQGGLPLTESRADSLRKLGC